MIYKPVTLESPYAGDIEANLTYLRRCLRDCLQRGEAPVASHGLYTQPGVLRDDVPEERRQGIAAGFSLRNRTDYTVVYTDLGVSPGMEKGVAHALSVGHRVEYRQLGAGMTSTTDARVPPPPRDCRCGAKVGERHVLGCSVERCAWCGDQLITCDCVYELNGLVDLETNHSEVYENGPTEEHWQVYDVRVAEVGGPLPWEGEYPGSRRARELGFFCRMVEGRGWQPCGPLDEGAGPDLNRLVSVASWDRRARQWVPT